MVVVLSRFRVANGMEGDVARAFRERPRAVESVPGFLWLEVFVDRGDPSIFYLVTRWSDFSSFEAWHGSAAHRESHELIPKGLKLDPAWTQVLHMTRLDGTLGPPVTETIADAVLLVGSYAAASTCLYVFALGRDGVIRACNKAADRLDPTASLEGRSLLDIMPQADSARLRERLARPGRTTEPLRLNFATARTTPVTLECWLDIRSDGAVLLGQPPFRQDQQLQDELMAINQELATLSRDRSRAARDERSARETAERLNRDRNAFLTVVAHELRQPIGAARAALSVLRKTVSNPMLERPRGVLERQLEQMTRLVEDLADTARVASGEIELRKTPVNLLQLLQQLTTVWEEAATSQHKTFAVHFPATMAIVNGDVDRLQQIFSNLVGNALKYTPEGGAVSVSASVETSTVTVSIKDEGEGIPADRLPYIFELFHRATTTGTGLGVGLAVVHALVRAHGGTITAESEGLGRGSTFAVRLPVARI